MTVRDEHSASTPVLLLGASCRALAWSCHAAGMSVRSLDQFADLDLSRLAQAERVEDWRQGATLQHLERLHWLPSGALDSASPLPVALPGGGLENHPRLWQALQRRTQWWGCDAQALRQVRSPRRLAEIASRAGWKMPETRVVGDPLPSQGEWLSKPLRSGGGQRIQRWTVPSNQDTDDGLVASRVADEQQHVLAASCNKSGPPHRKSAWQHRRHVLQRECRGDNLSAVFVAHRGTVRLIGVTSQLSGESRLNALGWSYAGSCGPLPVDDELSQSLMKLGTELAVVGLEGIFGVDLIRSPQQLWLLEVNPRYPAGAEVLERASGRSVVADYLALRADAGERSFAGQETCWLDPGGERRTESQLANEEVPSDLYPLSCAATSMSSSLPPLSSVVPQTESMVCKGIWYSGSEPLGPVRPDAWDRLWGVDSLLERPLADLPAPGIVIPPRSPVFTVFARVAGVMDGVEAMVRIARSWETLIFAPI